ncbi:MAG: glycosyltransferase [Kiritimatiellia bacterium]
MNASDWTSARKVLEGDLLSVVLPVYHLAGVIERNLEAVVACLDAGGIPYELVPVDDGSCDGTAAALRRAAACHPGGVRPAFVERNAGKGNALKVGFRASRGGYVLLLDGDLDIAPKMLPKFFDSMVRHGSDIVVGSKRHPESSVQYPWHRRLASIVYFGLVRLFIGLPVTDTQTGMKLFRREPLGAALDRMLVKTYAFDLELLAIARGRGAKISEAPVEIRFGQKFGALKARTVREMIHDTLAVFYRLRVLHYYAKVEVPPPLAKTPFVSVVIACPAGSWMLDECLTALAGQTHRAFEVIVLPDGELDAGRLPACPNLSVIPTGKVRPAEKRNLGIRAARGDVVAFIDDDAYPDARWIENAVKYFGNPDIGGVGGPGVTPPGDGFLAQAGGRVYENVFVSGAYRYRYVGGRVLRDVDDYPSCNLFVRTDLLRSFGGYRTDFWPGEDTLLCRSIVCEAKKRIVYDPWTLVYHHRRRLFGPHLRQLGRYGFHRGYFVKRFPENSLHLSYFVPTAFLAYVATLLIGWGAVAAWPAARGAVAVAALGVYTLPLAVYGVLTAASAVALNPAVWLVTWLGVIASHLCYGLRFVQGLCARKAPCEYIGADHARPR